MKVLVTGARGFVGSYLCPCLERAGVCVTGVDKEVEITNCSALSRVISECRPDAVVHLAAQSSVGESRKNPEYVFQVNVEGTRTLLEALSMQAPRATVLLVSSGEVYGDGTGRGPFCEYDLLNPDSPYAESKVRAESLAQDYAETGLKILCIRPFTHTGPGRQEAFVESALAKQLIQIELGRQPPRIKVGNLQTVRDFLDVEDVAEAYLALLHHKTSTGVYNIASGRGMSIGALLQSLVELTRAPRYIEIEEDPSLMRPASSSVGSNCRLREETGWAPRRNFNETLGRLLEDWRTRLGT